ncbi:GPI transamidase component GPI16 [Phellopilus nigrolimitatus]|nr:GPI transamidase component GPI16 [Phellopilus nigrolimitatus]
MSQADVPPHAPHMEFEEDSLTEVHLSLNAGKWDYGRWGYPADRAVMTGAELWAVDDRWKGLRNALSALFCASIGSLDVLRTTSPTHAFSPEGMLPRLSPNETHRLRHASLPSEHVCTENLTPFLKLLSCKSSAGIARLLNPHRLFDADWHDFSLRSLFDRTITKACPVATDSKIEVTLPQDVMYSITPEPSILHGQVGIFDVTAVRDQPLDISIHYPKEHSFSYPLDVPRSPLTDFEDIRTLTGTTQTHGRLSVSIKNNRPDEMQLVYVETMPWLVTLELTVDGRKSNGLMMRMAYMPPEVHLFEARLTLPAASALLRLGPVLVPVVAHKANVSAQRVYTPAVLVDLATPDFSMPYNVIIMSSTPIALVFGSVFNLLTRLFVAVKVNGDVGGSVESMVGSKVE